MTSYTNSAKQWNTLPEELKNNALPDFKRRVQIRLISYTNFLFVFVFLVTSRDLIFFPSILAMYCSYTKIRVKIKVMYVCKD